MITTTAITFLLLFLTSVNTFAASIDQCGPTRIDGDSANNYLTFLNTIRDYQSLLFRDANQDWLKFSIDRNFQPPRVFFQDSQKYPFHSGFLYSNHSYFHGYDCSEHDLNCPQVRKQVIVMSPSRFITGVIRFLACVSRYGEGGVISVELSAPTKPDIKTLVQVQDILRDSLVFTKATIIFVVNSGLYKELSSASEGRVILTSETQLANMIGDQ